MAVLADGVLADGAALTGVAGKDAAAGEAEDGGWGATVSSGAFFFSGETGAGEGV